MIINKPKIEETNEYIQISSIVEFKKSKNVVYYRIDKSFKDWLNHDLDAFVAGLIPIAMSIGEDIIAKGTMSQLLSYNLGLYQGYFNFFFKTKMKKIKIIADRYEKYDSYGKATISAFSGGINSFFTLLKNLNNKENTKYNVTDIMYVSGLNAPENRKLKELAKKLNVKPIIVETNLRELSNKYADFSLHSKGAILASCGLILKKYAGRFYIPSPFDYHVPFPYGSNPVTDILLSTENFEIIHHGSDFSKIQKLEYLTNYPLTYDNLFALKKNAAYGEYCYTAIALSMMDKLSLYKNSLPEQACRDFKKIQIKNEIDRYFAAELRNFAKRKNHLSIYRILKWKILIYNIKKRFT